MQLRKRPDSTKQTRMRIFGEVGGVYVDVWGQNHEMESWMSRHDGEDGQQLLRCKPDSLLAVILT